MTGLGLLEEGRRAYDRLAWAQAYDCLSADVKAELDRHDLERLAISAYLTGHDNESSEAWIRAHLAYLDGDEPEHAVRCTFWLAFGLMQRGEIGQAGGWLARARRLIEERKLDCVEAGYLLVPDALAAMESGDPSGAVDRFNEITDRARRFDDADLAALGTLGLGQTLMRLGQTARGTSLFDEAMVSVTVGELSPVVSGIIYCAVIDECQKALDIRRAQEWTVALDRWCKAQPGLVPYRGQCLVHRSQVLLLQGEWGDAYREAQRAQERLAQPPHPAIGMAYYQLGELHRLRGDLADAEESYRKAHEAGRGYQPGLALLRLAQDRVEDAVVSIVGAVDDARDEVMRAKMLPAFVEIMLASGRVSEARSAAVELTGLSASTDVTMLQALSSHSLGAVLLAEGDPRAALTSLRDAWQKWQRLDVPYETAQTRILIVLACRELGDKETAELECDAARKVLVELGAAPALKRLDELFGREPTRDAVITARELEVLRLVAGGCTNREISEQLVISEKTVERHLSNIFTKLGVTNRAAATAYAYDHDLVARA